jgi:adenylate cyclase
MAKETRGHCTQEHGMTAEARDMAAVLFVDVCGSTGYFERHGEAAGRAMLARCFAIVVPEIERHGGTVIKALGDGLLVVFDRASSLVAAVSALHSAIEDANLTLPAAERIAVHCGGDFGPVARDGGDVFGDVVNVAARLEALAGRGQTFVTSDLAARLTPNEREQLRHLGSFPVHGREREVETYEILWRTGPATVLIRRDSLMFYSSLRLDFQGRVLELPADRNRLTIGRDPDNDLVVKDAAVSHHHAEIVRRKGLFYLVDRSTNGTIVQSGQQAERYIQHAEFPLEGQGRLLLGHIHAPPVNFRVTQRVS